MSGKYEKVQAFMFIMDMNMRNMVEQQSYHLKKIKSLILFIKSGIINTANSSVG